VIVALSGVLNPYRGLYMYLLAAGLSFLLIPVLMRPQIGVAFIVGAVAVVLAWRSIVYPLVLSGIPAVFVGLVGSNPFPQGSVFTFLTMWLVLGIGFDLIRSGSLANLRPAAVPLALAMAIGVLLVLRSTGTPYAGVKIQLYLATAPLNLIAATLITQRSAGFAKYLKWWLVVAVLNGLLLLKQLLEGQSFNYYAARVTTSVAESPINAGRQAAYGALIGLFLILSATRPRLRLFGLISLPILAISLLASGSRGPVLALAVSLVVFFAFMPWSTGSRKRVLLAAAAAIVAFSVAPVVVPSASLARATAIFTGSDVGTSSNGRAEAWTEARAMFYDHPLLGDGTGSFALRNGVIDYPHNIILEGAAELGVLGAGLIVAALAFGFATAWALIRHAAGRVRTDVALVFAVFVGAVVNSMLSDGIELTGDVWTAIGLLCGLSSAYAREGVGAGLGSGVDGDSGMSRGRPREALRPLPGL
jgi:O-antigen ligase